MQLIKHIYTELDKKIELWKDIPGWIGLYRVSTHGRVKSMERMIIAGTRDKIVRPRYLKFGVDKDGYLSVTLAKEGVNKSYRVHRLVAMAFIPNPENLPLVNHIDNDVQNNCVWNLEWGTPLSNMQHSVKQGRKIAKNRKLTNAYVATIRGMYATGDVTMDELAKWFEVTRPTIGNIINNKTYKI